MRAIFGGVAFAVFLAAMPVQAQEQQGQQPQPDTQQDQNQNQENPTEPIPAIRSPLAGAAGNDQVQTDQGPLQPDTNSITGVQPVGIGSPAMTHNYWAPRISIAGTADSNPDYSVSSSDWSAWISILGGVDVHRASESTDLLLSYTGGGQFTNAQDVDNGVIQELSLRDRFLFHRSTFTVFEQLSYLPESSLGFAGTAGSGVPGLGGSIGVGTGFTPGQSLLTPRGQNLTSSTAGEWDYKFTPRTSITAVGSYALLHYFENDLANFGDASFQAGLNYQLTRVDSIAASYQFSAIRYSNLGQSINSNVIQGVYSRRVTGKLGFQIAAGPEFVTSNSPITSTSTTNPTGSVSTFTWTLNTTLTYAMKKVTIGASYNHGITGGSGLLLGSETDIATGTVSGRLSRSWNASANFGYSRNKGIGVGTADELLTYNYWFAGGQLSRTFGRSMDIFVNYQLQYQTNGPTACTGPGCSQTLTRNQISFGVNLHKQPIPF